MCCFTLNNLVYLQMQSLIEIQTHTILTLFNLFKSNGKTQFQRRTFGFARRSN